MPTTTVQRVPARYIGGHTVGLNAGAGPYFHGDGSPKRDLTLSPGDVLLLPEKEICGQSFLFDPKGQRDPLYLGTGRVVLPEHDHLSDEELSILGYEFHAGRADFEAIDTANERRQTAPLVLLPETAQAVEEEV